MCDKIDGWNPADIEAGGNGIEGYQEHMQSREGGVLDLGKKYVKMNQNAIHNANKYLLTEKVKHKVNAANGIVNLVNGFLPEDERIKLSGKNISYKGEGGNILRDAIFMQNTNREAAQGTAKAYGLDANQSKIMGDVANFRGKGLDAVSNVGGAVTSVAIPAGAIAGAAALTNKLNEGGEENAEQQSSYYEWYV